MILHQQNQELCQFAFICLLPVVHPKFYSKTAKKKSVSNGNELKKMHAAGKRWLTTHPKSIPLSLFC
jgi:hypothetical protein